MALPEDKSRVAFGKSERFYAANRFGRILPRRIAAQKKVGNAHFGGKLPQRADVRLGGRARHGGIEIQILVKIQLFRRFLPQVVTAEVSGDKGGLRKKRADAVNAVGTGVDGCGKGDVVSGMERDEKSELAAFFVDLEGLVTVQIEILIFRVQLDAANDVIGQKIERLLPCVRAGKHRAERNQAVIFQKAYGKAVDRRLLVRIGGNIQHDRTVDPALVHALDKTDGRAVVIRNKSRIFGKRGNGARREKIGKGVGMKIDDHRVSYMAR